MSSPLCETCTGYELDKLFTYGYNQHALSWDVYRLRQSCDFCRLLGWMLARTDLENGPYDIIEGETRALEGGQRALFFRFESSKSSTKFVKCPYIVLPLATGFSALSVGFTHLARAVESPSFDASLAREWLEQCDHKHGIECGIGSRIRPSSAEIRLIDIEAQCITPASATSQYVALSYVWGQYTTQPTLTRKNERFLRTWGSLETLLIPQTIKDAMTVCKLLGLRYLWVDSLCIVQDVEGDVQRQVAHMDVIFRKAYLTIIVATGNDCEAAIPSVSQPRDAVQCVTSVNGLGIGTVLLRVRNEILKSKWSTRAWTLQEYSLSFRSLIFTPKGVVFSCSEGVRREDMSGYWSKSLPRKDRYMFPIVLDFFVANRVDLDLLRQVYAPLVTNFTKRHITYAKDNLNAFQGILSALTPALKRFAWGVPAEVPEHMQYALCWSRADATERVREFPSWSWAGWTTPEDSRALPDGVQFLDNRRADSIRRIGDVYRPFKTEVANIVYKGETSPRVKFSGRSNKMLHLKTWIARINLSTHDDFEEWLQESDPTGELQTTFYEYLATPRVRDAQLWFKDAGLYLLLADASDFLIALPVRQSEDPDVYFRTSNPIFMRPLGWGAYKPKRMEVLLS